MFLFQRVDVHIIEEQGRRQALDIYSFYEMNHSNLMNYQILSLKHSYLYSIFLDFPKTKDYFSLYKIQSIPYNIYRGNSRIVSFLLRNLLLLLLHNLHYLFYSLKKRNEWYCLQRLKYELMRKILQQMKISQRKMKKILFLLCIQKQQSTPIIREKQISLFN